MSTRIRPHFDPRRGPIRRLERRISNFLVRRVYPRFPEIRVFYDRQIDRELRLVRASVPIRDLPSPFERLRILLLTDLHAGPFVRPEALRRAVARLCRTAEPDLLLYGGDLVTFEPADLVPDLLAGFGAPLGTFAVLGNHDHYSKQPEEVVRRLAAAGARVLENESVVLRRNRTRIRLAGIDDWHHGRPDLEAALAAGPPEILLSHNPDSFPLAASRGVPLTLSGHTHGGQIRIPGLHVLARQSRYRLDEGQYRSGGSFLVVCRGLGVTGVPLRVACPPEAVLVVLRRAESGSGADPEAGGGGVCAEEAIPTGLCRATTRP